ncbi:hypothetical protein KIMH_10190 [Bombiscardovia apis]|uniref:RCC1-like domain-containing protein n=1 Tax=Bombiscardovia apis TaxID=2932182 RepID=A0ABN6SGY7_9BIFI|nr:hypothetical protein [Bombiscardovia apis]BDR54908.1 hypothetical protein KIMH_10190 [Bombiscardovia apis]
MRGFRTASAATLALALIVLGGGAIGLTTSAHAEPTPNTTPSQHTRGNNANSETVDGFTLTPTKGPTNADATAALTPPGINGLRLTQISTAYTHSVAIGDDGNTYAWGLNSSNQLGDGTSTDRALPVRVRAPAGVRFVSVATGYYHSVALGDDGNAYAWGLNISGQLGDGTTTSRALPVKVNAGALPAGKRFTAISAGQAHTVALTDKGNIYSWGWNNYGQLGNYSLVSSNTPVKADAGERPYNERYIAVSAGQAYTAAVTDQGNAYCWGDNRWAQLGNTTIPTSNGNPNALSRRPVKVGQGALPAGERYTSISAGVAHTAAITDQGNAYCWGYNYDGELGDGSTSPGPTKWKNQPVKVLPGALPAGERFTAIGVGHSHTAALASDGNVYTWGTRSEGRLGDGTTTGVSARPVKVLPGELPAGERYTSISAGYFHTAALSSQGKVYTWGYNNYGQLGDGTTTSRSTPVRTLSPKYVIDSVKFDGVEVSRKTIDPITGVWDMHVPQRAPGAVDVTVTYHVSGALSGAGGTVSNGSSETATLHYIYASAYTVKFTLGDAVGHTSSPTPANQTVWSDDPQPIEWPSPDPAWEHHWFTGWADSTTGTAWDFTQPVTRNLTLKATWQAWKFKLSPTSGPDTGGNPIHITPPDTTIGITFTQVSAGGGHSLAIGTDGNTYAWGENNYGQLGDGTTTSRSQPVLVHAPAGVHFTQISASDAHSLAIGDDGRAYSWGYNERGQLGNGSSDNNPHSTPTPVNDPAGKPNTTWTSISAGSRHSLAVSSDHHAYSWGQNDSGQLGNGTTTDQSTPMPVNDPVGKPNTTWTSISAGYAHNLAISSDGHAYSWGYNERGQLGNGTSDTNAHNMPAPVNDPTGKPNTTWTSISAGWAHSLAISSDHHAYSWGYNGTGQLGNGGNGSQQSTPVPVNDPVNKPGITWTSISAGTYHSLALSSDHHAYSWGNEQFGQLGNGSNGTYQSKPVPVNDPTGKPNTTWTSISAGWAHSLAISGDHHAYSWGQNDSGQLGDGSTNQRNTPAPVDIPDIKVTGVKFDQTEASPTPIWNDPTWDTTAPAHTEGRVTANIHWTLGGIAQPDYPLPYDYQHIFTLPEAGAIPGQRLGGVTLLGLSLVAGLTLAGHQLSLKHSPAVRRSQVSAR